MSTYWMSDDMKVSVKTFDGYLYDAMKDGKRYHALRASEDANGNIQFYIHPLNADGETLDYKVVNNMIWPAHEAFQKPDERLVMFITTPDGKMFTADSMTWYINTLEKLYQAVKSGDNEQKTKILKEIAEAEEEL